MEPQNSRSVTPFEAALVIIVTFFVTVMAGGAALLLLSEGPTQEGLVQVIVELLILVVPLTFLLVKRVNVKNFIRGQVTPKFVLSGLIFGFVLLGLNIAVTSLLTNLFGTSQAIIDSNTKLYTISQTTTGFALVAASLILAGICEEFTFRGFLQNSITKRLAPQKYAWVPAVLISATVFGLFHFDPQGVYILAAFISGTALGLIYHHFNYVAAATAHATMNIIVLALLLLGI